jgi:hypothetical protein
VECPHPLAEDAIAMVAEADEGEVVLRSCKVFASDEDIFLVLFDKRVLIFENSALLRLCEGEGAEIKFLHGFYIIFFNGHHHFKIMHGTCNI